LNPANGSGVTSRTASGSAAPAYQICEILNPTTRIHTATVVNNAVIDAVNDACTSIIGATGGHLP
jgi:hypothetical protein